jgi:hypothetical protein
VTSRISSAAMMEIANEVLIGVLGQSSVGD